MFTLGLDSAGDVMAVGLLQDDRILLDFQLARPQSHSRLLPALVDDACRYAGCRPENLGLVAVTAGPGSYTGLRLGAMTAKVLAWRAGAPMAAVDAMQVLGQGFLTGRTQTEAAALAVLLPSRRQRVYGRAFDLSLQPLSPLHEDRFDRVVTALAAAADGKALAVLGAGGRPYRRDIDALLPPGSFWAAADADLPRGSIVARLGAAAAADGQSVAPLAFTPAYPGPAVADASGGA